MIFLTDLSESVSSALRRVTRHNARTQATNRQPHEYATQHVPRSCTRNPSRGPEDSHTTRPRERLTRLDPDLDSSPCGEASSTGCHAGIGFAWGICRPGAPPTVTRVCVQLVSSGSLASHLSAAQAMYQLLPIRANRVEEKTQIDQDAPTSVWKQPCAGRPAEGRGAWRAAAARLEPTDQMNDSGGFLALGFA